MFVYEGMTGGRDLISQMLGRALNVTIDALLRTFFSSVLQYRCTLVLHVWGERESHEPSNIKGSKAKSAPQRIATKPKLRVSYRYPLANHV